MRGVWQRPERSGPRIPLKTRVTFTRTFSSAHTSVDCGPRIHGHDWTAQVTVGGVVDFETGSIDTDAGTSLSMLVAGFDNENLDVVLPGVYPTPEGIAAWLAEQLRLDNPGLVSVTVGFAGRSATMEV